MLAVLISGMLFSQAGATRLDVSGPIIANTVWDTDTVMITNHVSVQQGVLNILPGTLVQFAFQKKLVDSAYGAIHAVGTPERPIHFKGTNTQFAGGIKFSALVHDSLTVFRYCTIEYMAPCLEFRNPPDLPGEPSCPVIDHCVIRSGSYTTIYVTGGASPTITNCQLNNATSGIFVHGAGDHMVVRNCLITNMGCGIINASMMPWSTTPGHNLTVDQVTFYNLDGVRKQSGVEISAGCGITCVNAAGVLNVTNCIFDSLAHAGLYGFSPNWTINTDYNCFYQCPAGPVMNSAFSPGSHSIEANPQFTDPQAKDFTYPATSPCWGAGSDGSSLGFQPTGVTWIDDGFDRFRETVWPELLVSTNPAGGAVSFRFRSTGIMTVKIFSQAGALVWERSTGQPQPEITWSGRDLNGRMTAGIYYAMAGDGKRTVRQQIVKL
jgi:hypothetical protein